MQIRIFKLLSTVFLTLGILCLGLYLGGRIEKGNHALAEAEGEFIQTIAVVDLDDGVILEQMPVYYANDFLIFPNSNFTVTGLEDARQGIYQGRYAAYVIIPASFSKTIASINGIPQKSTLEYSVNPNLDTGIKGEVISDIQQFQMLLNTNISYVFVSAILDEFHNSQDASVIVLKNDKNELEKIKTIEAEQLLWEMSFSELEFAEYIIEELDVDGSFADSKQLLVKMGEDIRLNISAGQDEFETIMDQDDDFTDASKELFDALAEIVPGEDSDGNLVYENGLIELGMEIDVYQNNLTLLRTVIANRLYQITDDYRTTGEAYLNDRITQLQNEVNMQLSDQLLLMQNDVDEALQQIQTENLAIIQEQLVLMQQERENENAWIQNYIDRQLELVFIDLKEIYEEDANQQMEGILIALGYLSTPSNATPSNATPNDVISSEDDPPPNAYRIHLATASNAEISLSDSGLVVASIIDRIIPLKDAVSATWENRDPNTDIWITLQIITVLFPDNYLILPSINFELYQTLAVEVGALCNISVDAIRTILQEQVIEEIERENEAQKTRIERFVDRLRDKMDDYEKSIEDFDPYIYVRINDISGSLGEIEKNLSVINQMVYEKTYQDSEFVATAYDLIGKNADTLKEDIEKANLKTLDNILTAIDTIQTSRITTNDENTYLLEEFGRKLSYTRLGSVGNKEAYDFIVRPVSMASRDPLSKSSLVLDTQLGKYLLIGVCLMAAAGSGMIVTLLVWISKKRR